jgi:hypothetical protein
VTVVASLADVATAAPIAFCVGVFVGLLLSTRYRITRRDDDHSR